MATKQALSSTCRTDIIGKLAVNSNHFSVLKKNLKIFGKKSKVLDSLVVKECKGEAMICSLKI